VFFTEVPFLGFLPLLFLVSPFPFTTECCFFSLFVVFVKGSSVIVQCLKFFE
jgi:hypothetical protein